MLYIKGHLDGSIFYIDTDLGRVIQDAVFTINYNSPSYQYIPIGHIVDVSANRPIINFVGGYVNDRIFDYNDQFGLVPSTSLLDNFNKTQRIIKTSNDVSLFLSSGANGMIDSHIIDVDLTADPSDTGLKTTRTLYIKPALFATNVLNILNKYPDAKVIIRFWFKSIASAQQISSIRINFSAAQSGTYLLYSSLLKDSTQRGISVPKTRMAYIEISKTNLPDSALGTNYNYFSITAFGDPTIFATS